MAKQSDAISDEMLLARIGDAMRAAQLKKEIRFLGFLDQRQASVALSALKRQPFCTKLWGGFECAERSILGISLDELEQDAFPIQCLCVRYRTKDQLSHRDVLGSLMSLGLKRDTVGDIVVSDGMAHLFVRSEISSFVCEQLTMIRRVGVSVAPVETPHLSVGKKVQPIKGTVASMRLDCVVSMLTGRSREESAKLIQSKLVYINHLCCENKTKQVSVSDQIVIRGYGKFEIESEGPITKKGRIVLQVIKYV